MNKENPLIKHFEYLLSQIDRLPEIYEDGGKIISKKLGLYLCRYIKYQYNDVVAKAYSQHDSIINIAFNIKDTSMLSNYIKEFEYEYDIKIIIEYFPNSDFSGMFLMTLYRQV